LSKDTSMSRAFVALVALISSAALSDAEVSKSDAEVSANTKLVPSQRLPFDQPVRPPLGKRRLPIDMSVTLPTKVRAGSLEDMGAEHDSMSEAFWGQYFDEPDMSDVKLLVRSVFESFDTDGSGLLEAEELMWALHTLRLNPEELLKNAFVTDSGLVINHKDLMVVYDDFFDIVLAIATGEPPHLQVLSRESAPTADAAGPLISQAALARAAAGSFMTQAAQERTADKHIFISWIALDRLAPKALEKQDWNALAAIRQKAHDSLTFLPLYNLYIDGSDLQEELDKDAREYEAGCAELAEAIHEKDIMKAQRAVTQAHDALVKYRFMQLRFMQSDDDDDDDDSDDDESP